jgi:predicted alpha/beta-fold hydrolase
MHHISIFEAQLFINMHLIKLWRGFSLFPANQKQSPYVYRPAPLLPNHAFQSVYEVLSPSIAVDYEREKIFFVDGGHVSLDWVNKF